MQIQIDSREKARAIQKIVKQFDDAEIKHYTSKLYVGDYVSLDNSRLCIDRKQNLSELYGNLCQGHERFRAELIRAKEAGIKLIILIEHGGKIKTLDDVKNWENPQKKHNLYAWDGMRMHRTMKTVADKYGIEYRFCDKRNTGEMIIKLLGGDDYERR